MKKSKEKMKKYGFLIAIIVVILLGFTAYSVSNDRKLTWIEKTTKETVLRIGDILAMPIRVVKEKVSLLSENETIYKKYEELRKKYVIQEQLEEEIKGLKEENEELKRILELDTSLSEYEKVYATIISRDSTYWLDSFVIDKGTKDGVKDNMAVMGDGGFIGYIFQAGKNTSTVKLFTNPNLDNKVSIKIEVSKNQYAYGLLTGYDAEKGVYRIEGISDYVDIPISASVTTTGLGDRFPSELLLGTVQDVKTDSFDLAKIVFVKPNKSTDELSFVTILVRGDEES